MRERSQRIFRSSGLGCLWSFEAATGESAADVKSSVATALDSGAAHIEFADAKGNSYLVPTAALAYVELGSEESRRVGFVA